MDDSTASSRPLPPAAAVAARREPPYLDRRLLCPRSPPPSPPPAPRVDRISLLPDELILRILNFLSLTQAARTAVLSRRWRHLWASNPTLDFNHALYASYYASSSGHRHHGRPLRKAPTFECWVTNVLTLSEARIETLKISFRGFDPSVIGLWLRIASKRAVEDVRFMYSPASDYEVPPEIGFCKSLVALELRDVGAHGDIKLTAIPKLASLKTLRLVSVSLNCQLVPTLISGCPCLENLGFEGCNFITGLGAKTLNVTSSVLKTLHMKKCSGDQQGRTLNLKVDAPSLVSFRYTGALGGDCILKNLSSLVEAKFSFREAVMESSFLKLLQGLWRVQSLTLSHLMLKKNGKLDSSMKMAHYSNHLKYLQLKTLHQQDYVKLVVNFLKRFPNLETFIIDASQVHDGKLLPGPNIQKKDYGCAAEHLKVLEIQGFSDEKSCISFLIYILENASSLQKIKLIYKKGLPEFDEQRSLCRVLRRTRKASSQAKVVFSSCF